MATNVSMSPLHTVFITEPSNDTLESQNIVNNTALILALLFYLRCMQRSAL